MSFDCPEDSDFVEEHQHIHVQRDWDWPLQANDGVVKVQNDDDKFEVHLDAQHFTPKEIKVRVIGRLIDIHCEHTKRPGDIGDVSRVVARSYQLPDDVNEALVRSSLSHRGVLVITAMKKPHLSWPPRMILHDSAWVGVVED